jgi:hypothetical protein
VRLSRRAFTANAAIVLSQRVVGLPAAGLTLTTGSANAAPPAVAAPEIAMATISGGQAIDRDALGGNPFASAFIQLLDGPPGDFAATMTRRTEALSDDFQHPDLSGWRGTTPRPSSDTASAVAAVIVFAHYPPASGLASLPGAAFDAVRVEAALRRAGFETQRTEAADEAAYRTALAELARRSANADQALVYTTGHGIELGGQAYLLTPGHRREKAAPHLPGQAIPISDIQAALHAKTRNMLFYGACRDRIAG